MKLQLDAPLVSPAWLMENLDAPNLVVLDATMAKVTTKAGKPFQKKQIRNARFFDIKHVFSDQNSPLPNTMLSEDAFEKKAQAFGINQDTAIVVYDDLGIYSAPRVWWMFRSMGHTNIAVLDGGLPAWQQGNFPIEDPIYRTVEIGNFKANYQSEMFCNSDDVLKALHASSVGIIDARSKSRFDGTEAEPRKEIRSGHIPSSQNLPFSTLHKDGKMLSKDELTPIFKNLTSDKEHVIFSCGSGITASILALGADIVGLQNTAVYDGSWTDWGGNHELPIQKK